MTRPSLLDRLARSAGPAAAALVAAAAALPGLRLPFLSDDWHLVESVAAWPPPPDPYGYFRPLYMATFWLDRRLWGLSASNFHLTNLLLLAASAALVVVLVRRYTGHAPLAALTGLLFALHPYHVENAAWIAVRGDPLYSGLLLLAAWAYDRWRRAPASRGRARKLPLPMRPLSAEWEPHRAGDTAGDTASGAGARPPALGDTEVSGARAGAMAVETAVGAEGVRGLPLAALALFEGALLAKESALVLPGFLVLLGFLDRRRRAPAREWIRGLLPLFAIALAHLFVLKPLMMPGPVRSLAPGTALGWLKHVPGYVVAAFVPIESEILAAHPWRWAGLAALALLAVIVIAWLRAGAGTGVRAEPEARAGSRVRAASGARAGQRAGQGARAETGARAGHATSAGTGARAGWRASAEPSARAGQGEIAEQRAGQGASVEAGARSSQSPDLGAGAGWFPGRIAARVIGMAALPAAAGACFLLLLAPSIIGFQERYLFLPLAASCLLLASLLVAIGGRLAIALTAAVLAGWVAGGVRHWYGWSEAGTASRRLVADLVEASRRPGIDEIVVANMPFRVHGGSVAGDFGAAVRLSGGRDVRVTTIASVSYPRAESPAAAAENPAALRPLSLAVRRFADSTEVQVRVPEGPFSHFVNPRPGKGPGTLTTPVGSARFVGSDTLLITVPLPLPAGKTAFAWVEGRLEPL